MTDALHHIVVLAPCGSATDMDAGKARMAAAELAATAGTGFSSLSLSSEGPEAVSLLPGERACWRPCPDGIGAMARAAADTLAGWSDRPLLVLTPPGPDGEALAALVAARAGFQPLGRCERLVLDGARIRATSQRGGRIRRHIACEGSATAVLRPQATMAPLPGAVLPEAGPAAMDTGNGDLPVERRPLAERQAALEGARLVVSGGRGLDPDGFALLARLADRLGGAVGASLPAIDLGLAPVSRQVGQSGKFVSPELYLAVGLSGTPQHLAGIAPVSRIVAINSDPQAPIFQFAELGLVADWREVLPALLTALEA